MTLRTVWAVLALCILIGAGCERDLRVPYIPPTLANWPQPYHGVSGVKIHVFNTGYLRAPEALILRGGSLTRTRNLPVPAFVIEHPKQGLVIFNTGLDPRPDHASPWGGLASLVAPEITPDRGLKAQMEDAGLKPSAVKWIVLSNLRFDHTGELDAFPHARVVVAKAEHDYARDGRSGYVASDFADVANWKFIDFDSAKPVATFLAHVDLFGDGSCLLVDGSGFTPGTIAMIVRLRRHPVLLADDMAGVDESVRYAAKPASAYDIAQWWDHIWRLKRFKDLVPGLIVLPGHELDTALAADPREITVHDFAAPEEDAPPTRTPGMLERLLPKPDAPQ